MAADKCSAGYLCVGLGGAGRGGRICPKDAPLDLRSFADEAALIHSDSRGESYIGGSVACKSH